MKENVDWFVREKHPLNLDHLVAKEIDLLRSMDAVQRKKLIFDDQLSHALRKISQQPEMQEYVNGINKLLTILAAIHRYCPSLKNEEGEWHATLKDYSDEYNVISYTGTYLEAYLAGAKLCTDNRNLYCVYSVSKEFPTLPRIYKPLTVIANATAIVENDPSLKTLKQLCEQYLINDR